MTTPAPTDTAAATTLADLAAMGPPAPTATAPVPQIAYLAPTDGEDGQGESIWYGGLWEKPPTAQWAGVLCADRSPSADGRYLCMEQDGWRALPLTLKAQHDVDGVSKWSVVGRIDKLWWAADLDGTMLLCGSGIFDVATPAGQETARMVWHRLLTGVSIELTGMQPLWGSFMDAPIPQDGGGDIWMCVTGKIAACAMTATPALERAQIGIDAAYLPPPPPPLDPDVIRSVVAELAGQPDPDVVTITAAAPPKELLMTLPDDAALAYRPPATALAVVAAAAADWPVTPDREAFRQRTYDRATALTVDRVNGWVHGHVLTWADPDGRPTRHLGTGVESRVLKGDHFRKFNARALPTADGGDVLVGNLTMGGGHFNDLRGTAEAALEHYENVGTVYAQAVAYEDRHGIAVAGALMPGIGDADIRLIMSTHPSIDARPDNLRPGKRTLAGVHQVVTGGFQVDPFADDVYALTASTGEPLAMIATCGLTPEGLTFAEVCDRLIALEQRERAAALAGQLRARLTR